MSATASCLFCRIASGEIPSATVYQSDRVQAFLDINPIRAGHTLIIPRQHFPYFDDLPAEVLAEMMSLAQRLAPVLRERHAVERVACFYSGVDIAHAHAHVFPMLEWTDLTSPAYIVERPLSFRRAAPADPAALAAEAAALGSVLGSASGSASGGASGAASGGGPA